MPRLTVAAAALGTLVLGAARAQADMVVTRCATDTQAPLTASDRNFADAMAAGGRITFRCGGRATLRITRAYQMRRATEIDGGGLVTLDRLGKSWIFLGNDPMLSLRLVDLTIVNAGSRPRPPDPGYTSLWIPGSVIRGRLRVALLRTSITGSWWPIWMTGGSIRVERSSFSSNDGSTISAPNVEILDRSQFSGSRGSAVYSQGGQVVIEDSDFWANTVPSTIGRCTRLRITRSRFNGHTGTARGGALRIDCDATIEESEFRGNGAVHGGAIWIGTAPRLVSLRAVKFSENRADSTGGAIGVEPSATPLELQLRHVTFTDNRARSGGAIALDRVPSFGKSLGNTRALTGAAVAFVRNTATLDGGAIDAPNASLRLTRGVFVGNRAGQSGGAVAALQQGPRTTMLVNSLLVRNGAARGAAFWGNAATFTNTTIADNGDAAVWAQARTLVPGATPAGAPASFPIRFLNTIVAGGGAAACGPSVAVTPYQDLGSNLQHPGTSCGATITSASPALGPDYVPWFWSPAIDGGDDAVCTAPPVARKDLYNDRRPLSAHCTIGAVEGSISHLVHRWRRRGDGPFAAMQR